MHSAPVEMLEVPTIVPVCSVSNELNAALRDNGMSIEIDPVAAGTILASKGFPESELDAVLLNFKFRAALNSTEGGSQVSRNSTGAIVYEADMAVSTREIRTCNSIKMQEIWLHELTHLRDLHKMGPEAYSAHLRQQVIAKRMASLAVGSSVFSAASVIALQNINEAMSHYGGNIGTALVAPVAILGTIPIGSLAARFAVYRMNKLERPAYRAQRKERDMYPLVAKIIPR